MVSMKRRYENLIKDHFSEHRQIALISGPRQVGKTTLANSIRKQKNTHYFNWDDSNDRETLLAGSRSIAEKVNFDTLLEATPLMVFDEIHKYGKWKQLIKGFHDRYKDRCDIIVTGSARMDVYKKGGDSLMGRYFNYRLHPLSISETMQRPLSDSEIQNPSKPSDKQFERLLQWGGFPEPFIKSDRRFFNRWSRLREQQLLAEDIRELTGVHELGQLETLAILLKNQAGQLTSYSSLAKKVRVSVDTIRRWTSILESLYYCFSVRPWSRNVTRSILKEPKYYLWDWSQCQDIGARNENFIASHLLKAVHFWTDLGYGNYELHYLRDKEKREVDFLVSRDAQPWFLVEVKSSTDQTLSPHLARFARQIKAEHAFQVAISTKYIDRDPFQHNEPLIVPARTFLSQLP